MLLKELVRTVAAQNTYINQAFYKTASLLTPKVMYNIYNEMATLDTIKDTAPLKIFRREVELGRMKVFGTRDINYANTHYYGILFSLFGKTCKKVTMLPAIEHGLFLIDAVMPDTRFTARASCATLSHFRREIIHKYQNLPVFCVGPHIHYSDSFYSDLQLQEEKQKLGKTLAVFPTHSTANAEINIHHDLFIQRIRKLAKSYDTVLINTYWWDINSPITERLQAEGWRIVSAGHNYDCQFLPRLKTIISMADFVVSDGIGTHVGYCVHMGKPFSYLELGTELKLLEKNELVQWNFRNAIEQEIKTAFHNVETIDFLQWEICNKYWGLDQIKTQEELQAICEITRDIALKGHGFTAAYPKAAQSLLKKYQDSDQIKYWLLLEAMPKSVR